MSVEVNARETPDAGGGKAPALLIRIISRTVEAYPMHVTKDTQVVV